MDGVKIWTDLSTVLS